MSAVPSSARTGAALRRAKAALGEAIDTALGVDTLHAQTLAKVIGCPVSEAYARLDAATLGEVVEWTGRVGSGDVCERGAA